MTVNIHIGTKIYPSFFTIEIKITEQGKYLHARAFYALEQQFD